jgi:signal transduction histidine kinase
VISVARLRGRLGGGTAISVTIIGLLFLIDLSAMAGASAGRPVKSPPLEPFELLMAAAGAGVFWWRRVHPVRVFWLTLAIGLLAASPHRVGLATESSGLAIAIATYNVGSWSVPRPASIAPPALLFAVLFVVALGAGPGVALAVAAAVVALPWVAGYAIRSRRLYVQAMEQRLAQAERERDERARQAVRDERSHIARELHDIVAHHVSVIGVQAGAARLALDAGARDATRDALLVIESASREAVGEMRHLLSALRREEDGPEGAEAPQPGIADLDRLAGSFRNTGMTVGLSTHGAGETLPPTLGLCCYRIVEEALTNVSRHCAVPRAEVDVDVGPAAVHVVVRDPGPAAPHPGGGRGHLGMRERVALFGGTLQTGTGPGGGYVVDATIPRTPGTAA